MKDTKNLFEQECGVLHFTGDNLVILLHHELNELDHDFSLVGVHDDIHDYGDGLFVHLGLFAVQSLHVFRVVLDNLGQEDGGVLADRFWILFQAFGDIGQDLDCDVPDVVDGHTDEIHYRVYDLVDVLVSQENLWKHLGQAHEAHQ